MSKVLKISFILNLILLSHIIYGQNVKKLDLERSEQITYAKNLIKDLRDGYLIVRLQSFNTQVRYFDKLISDPSTDKKTVERSKSELKKILNNRDTFNYNLIRAIDSVYRFSKVRFIYDKDLSLTDIHVNNQSFLNDQLIPDTSMGIGSSKYLIMGYVIMPTSDDNSKQYFRVLTPDFTEVPREIQVPGSGLAFNFTADNGSYKNLKRVMIKKVLRFDRRLQDFYDENVLGKVKK